MASGFKIKIVHAENIKADIDESEIVFDLKFVEFKGFHWS